MKNIFNKKEKGVAVLFAVLVAVLLVSIGATIVSIALRQTILSSTGRESQYAFYAANTALECALYWDFYRYDDFNETPLYVFPSGDAGQGQLSSGDFNCAGMNISDDWDGDPDDSDGRTFEFILTNSFSDEDFCAKATVKKINDGSNLITTIEAKGYNSSSCDDFSARTVERGLELSYTS